MDPTPDPQIVFDALFPGCIVTLLAGAGTPPIEHETTVTIVYADGIVAKTKTGVVLTIKDVGLIHPIKVEP